MATSVNPGDGLQLSRNKTIVSTVSAAVAMALKTVTGKLCDAEFASRRNVLVYAVNAVGCDAFGLIKDLHQVYSHESVYSRRKRLYNLSRSMVSTRDEPGTLIVQEPLGTDKSPTLIACVTQFGWGASIEDNVKAMQAANKSHDWHYVEGLKEDTKINRRHHFKTCMKKLVTLAMGHKDMEKIIIAEGMGCRGKLDEEWREYYLPAIETLATRLEPFGIQTVLVCTLE